MKIKRVTILFLPVLLACQIDLPEEPRFLPEEKDATVLSIADYVSHTEEKLVFDVEVIVLNSFYRGFDNDYLTKEDFEWEGEGIYTIESFEFVLYEPLLNSSAIVVLLDQSGSYDDIDPYNTRSQSISKFLNDINAPHTVLVGGCAKQGKLSQEPVEYATESFGSDLRLNTQYLFSMAKRTGGNVAALDGVRSSIAKLSASNPTMRRELVLLVHANDTSIDVNDIIAEAKLNNVAVHTIILGDDPDKNLFSRLSVETGGMFAACPSEKELTKVFNELERLINGERGVYKMRVSFKPSQGQMLPGAIHSHIIEILDPFTELSYNPVFVTVKIPS